jgi:hypothetical protein
MQPLMSTNVQGAAAMATSAPQFYNVTLKNLFLPATNRDQSVFVPLNDYVVTAIGMIKDDVPFNTALSADILYTLSTGGLPAPATNNNDHYSTADTKNVDISASLVKTTQTQIYGSTIVPAGLITTRASSSAFFINGTNRAMFRFTLVNHLCRDMEQVQDTSRPTDMIRQDVASSPGGDSRVYLNNCIGCHSGMDPMAQAFAYYDFNNTDPTTADTAGQIVYTAGQVQPKYFINNTNFPQGYVTPNDHWDNRWRSGVNSLLGWDPNQTGSGQGAKSLGQELGGSQAFASCQVTRVFKYVCFRAPTNAADRTQVASMIASFKSSNYSLRQVFADAAVYCMGN